MTILDTHLAATVLSFATAARHTVETRTRAVFRYFGPLPQPDDHQVVILAGRVEHLDHPAGCPGGWCPVVDALSREDGRLPAGVFLAVPLGDGFVALDLATGGGR